VYNNQNVIYSFSKYEMLINFITSKAGLKESENVLEYLKNNSKDVREIYLSKKPTKAQKINPNQTSLF
jgi:hypothetical protein